MHQEREAGPRELAVERHEARASAGSMSCAFGSHLISTAPACVDARELLERVAAARVDRGAGEDVRVPRASREDGVVGHVEVRAGEVELALRVVDAVEREHHRRARRGGSPPPHARAAAA